MLEIILRKSHDFALSRVTLPFPHEMRYFFLINQFFNLYASYKGAEFLDEYRWHSYILHQQVVLELNHKKISGKVRQISDAAELVLEDSQGQRQHFSAGEITKVHLKERLYHG